MRAREDGRARDRAWNSDGLAAIEPINELLGVVPKAKAESEHHPVRCLRSSTCANRAGEFSGTTGSDRPINAASVEVSGGPNLRRASLRGSRVRSAVAAAHDAAVQMMQGALAILDTWTPAAPKHGF